MALGRCTSRSPTPRAFGRRELARKLNNLDGELRADRPILSRLGLHAFLYGAESDPVADPAENPAFAAALRAAGAHAESAVYPGGHSLDTVREHLSDMLTFAGQTLRGRRASARGDGIGALGGALGAAALGALAIGAGAVGALAIGRLAVRRAAIGSLEVGDVKLERLTVGQLIVEQDARGAGETAGGKPRSGGRGTVA